MHEAATVREFLGECVADRADVVVETSAGGRHAGTVAMLGLDVAVLSSSGQTTAVAVSAIAAVRSTRRRQRTGAGTPEESVDVTLLELLADRMDERPDVIITIAGAQQVAGRLASVGHDVVTVHPDTPTPQSIHIPVPAIVSITIA